MGGPDTALPSSAMDICGKTGTVQVIGNEKKKQTGEDIEDHSWFAGFASRDNPEIAVVVFIEHGGMGGIAAAPLAREVFSAYFEKHKPKMMASSPAPGLAIGKGGVESSPHAND